MASHARCGGDVRLIWRLVFREADVAIGPEDLARTVLGLKRFHQRDHRSFDRVLVDLAVGLEVALGVVKLESDEEALALLRPSTERCRHSKAPRLERSACHISVNIFSIWSREHT